jgi:hypothetical protein
MRLPRTQSGARSDRGMNKRNKIIIKSEGVQKILYFISILQRPIIYLMYSKLKITKNPQNLSLYCFFNYCLCLDIR